MNTELAAFLSRLTPGGSAGDAWGAMRFEITAYLTAEPPPPAYTTSVRAVVTRGSSLLVVRDPENVHILPGGRREHGESMEQTLRREVLEETGWSLLGIKPLGILHFHHLTPEPPGYAYPFPDFLQAVYVARADEHLAHLREQGGYELDAQFQPLAAIRKLPLRAVERVFLDAVSALP